MSKHKNLTTAYMETKPRLSLVSIIIAVIAILAAIPLFAIFGRSSVKLAAKPVGDPLACDMHFNTNTYGMASPGKVHARLMGELHGNNEEQVVACLATFLQQGDHLLIEADGAEGREIPCDTVNVAYQKLNDYVKCYGFDIPITRARQLFSDFAFRANFIAENFPEIFFKKARSPQAVIELITSFAELLIVTPSAPETRNSDPEFNQRQAKYLKDLAKRLQGLSLQGMSVYVTKENNYLADQADIYEFSSRRGPTNEALIKHIHSHQRLLQGSHNNLFVVAGARHLDITINSHMKKMIEATDSATTISLPKQYASTIK